MAMIEEQRQNRSTFPITAIIPRNAVKLSFNTESFDFYINEDADGKTLYLYVTSYHPGVLSIPISKLKEFIKYIEQENLS